MCAEPEGGGVWEEGGWFWVLPAAAVLRMAMVEGTVKRWGEVIISRCVRARVRTVMWCLCMHLGRQSARSAEGGGRHGEDVEAAVRFL